MPGPIEPDVRRRVIEYWTNGATYQEIHSMVGVSVGQISNIINEERKRVPDLKELRSLNNSLREAGVSVNDAELGVKLLDKLSQLNISPARLEDMVGIYGRYGGDTGKVLTYAVRIRDLENSQHLAYDLIVEDVEEKARQRVVLEGRIAQLVQEESDKKKSLAELEALRAVQEKLN